MTVVDQEEISEPTYKFAQIKKIFFSDISRTAITQAEAGKKIPQAQRTNGNKARVWRLRDLPSFGEKWGYIDKPAATTVVTIFASKGGVHKSTLALNTARTAALHGIKTLVVGLDVQGDISTNLDYYDFTGIEDPEEILEIVDETNGLSRLLTNPKEYDLLGHGSRYGLITGVEDNLDELLHLIPEDPQLAQLDRLLTAENNREMWLKNHVVTPLRGQYDLIIFDCSPNWSNLITNALAAADIVLTPLQCGITHFRNFPVFRQLMNEFKSQFNLGYKQLYVPTRLSSTQKLSPEIRTWYLKQVPGTMQSVIKETVVGEEAVANKLSVQEYKPGSSHANDLMEFTKELFTFIEQFHAKA